MEQSKFYQIKNITEQEYTLVGCDGSVITRPIQDVDKSASAFTIQDAKAGDVLCDCCEEYDNPLIFILKKFERVNFGLVRPSDYSSYCFLTAGDRQIFKEGRYHHKHNITPATKEQRDLLFQKMKEAGYEWDADKKELKKIEQNPADKVEPKFKVGDKVHLINGTSPNYEDDCIVISDISNDTYYGNWEGGYFAIKDQDNYELVEKKPVEWTQDNVDELTEFENAMMHIGGSFFGENAGLDPNDTSIVKEQARLLLELVQKPAEWSKEDTTLQGKILFCLKSMVFPSTEEREGMIEWLKTLSERYTPQSQQEWSEADEKDIQECAEYLRRYAVQYVQGGNSKQYVLDLADRIESLRPQNHWKPSKEQMEAFEEAVKPKLSGFGWDETPIGTLYNDLMKL